MNSRHLMILALISSLLVFSSACNVDDEPTVSANNDQNDPIPEPCETGRAVCSDQGECVPNTTISSGQGGSAEASYSCECDTGYTGDLCLSCDTGYEADDAGACVPSPTCEDVMCGNGACEISDAGVPECVCSAGWVGDACDACEAGKLEYEADSGACVADLCAADPCADDANATDASCTMPAADAFECACATGYLWNAGVCEAQCTDVDQDGYGVGPACLGTDCLDTNIGVWEDNQSSILRAEITGGATTVSVGSNDVISLEVDYLFTRDSANPTNYTKVMVAYHSPNSHYIPWTTCVVAEQAPLACAAGGTVGSQTIDIPTPYVAGDFELRYFVSSGPDESCASEATALGMAALPDLGTKIADVTVAVNQCMPGRAQISNVRFNGATVNRYVATPGETVVLTVDWATAKGGCAGCVAPVAVGWAGNKLGCVYSGVPSTCTAAGGWATTGTNRNFTFTAPTAPGIYPLRWAISLVFNCDVNFANPSPFNTWGVLEVQ